MRAGELGRFLNPKECRSRSVAGVSGGGISGGFFFRHPRINNVSLHLRSGHVWLVVHNILERVEVHADEGGDLLKFRTRHCCRPPAARSRSCIVSLGHGVVSFEVVAGVGRVGSFSGFSRFSRADRIANRAISSPHHSCVSALCWLSRVLSSAIRASMTARAASPPGEPGTGANSLCFLSSMTAAAHAHWHGLARHFWHSSLIAQLDRSPRGCWPCHKTHDAPTAMAPLLRLAARKIYSPWYNHLRCGRFSTKLSKGAHDNIGPSKRAGAPLSGLCVS